ncbi:hypothetical protein V8E53_004945, partial [Lactarius tabidus]
MGGQDEDRRMIIELRTYLREVVLLAGPRIHVHTHSRVLTSNASLFLPSVHGRTLTAEVHSVAQSVLTSLENLARAHLSLIATVPTKGDATSGTEEYLSKTAVVHELIAQAKAADPQSLSRSNLIAVRKRWLEHSETVSDASAEAMLEFEAFASDDDDDKDTEFDDGWDDPDLYLGSDKGEQGPKQKQLAKTILPVVHHASALLKDVKIALLSRTSRLARSLPDTLLDDLLDSAPPFAAAVDNLADEIFNSPDILSDLDQSRDKFVRKEDPRPANERDSRIYFIDHLFSGRPHPQTSNELLISPYIVRGQLCTTKCQNTLIGFIVRGFA